jgi:hypothetical protein
MTKSELLPRILEILEDQHRVMLTASREATENATGDETRSDGKYDTRATEAAYLAEAQAEQAEKLAEAITSFKSLELPEYELTDAIGPGALVETDLDGETSFYLLVPSGGGTTLEHLGCELTLLTPDAPLYQKLLKRKAGEMLEQPEMMLLGVE